MKRNPANARENLTSMIARLPHGEVRDACKPIYHALVNGGQIDHALYLSLNAAIRWEKEGIAEYGFSSEAERAAQPLNAKILAAVKRLTGVRSTGKTRNPSSGAKQRSRGTRTYQDKGWLARLKGTGGKGQEHARALRSAVHARKLVGEFIADHDLKGRPRPYPIEKDVWYQEHQEELARARRNRPQLPNPSSGAKQRARGTRDIWLPAFGDEHGGWKTGRDSKGQRYSGWIDAAENDRRRGSKVAHEYALSAARDLRPRLPNPAPLTGLRVMLCEVQGKRTLHQWTGAASALLLDNSGDPDLSMNLRRMAKGEISSFRIGGGASPLFKITRVK